MREKYIANTSEPIEKHMVDGITIAKGGVEYNG